MSVDKIEIAHRLRAETKEAGVKGIENAQGIIRDAKQLRDTLGTDEYFRVFSSLEIAAHLTQDPGIRKQIQEMYDDDAEAIIAFVEDAFEDGGFYDSEQQENVVKTLRAAGEVASRPETKEKIGELLKDIDERFSPMI